jgi:hypothetical protein
LTVHDISWLSLYCISFRENFGHVMIPKDLDVPPALGQNQLTVSPKFKKLNLAIFWLLLSLDLPALISLK